MTIPHSIDECVTAGGGQFGGNAMENHFDAVVNALDEAIRARVFWNEEAYKRALRRFREKLEELCDYLEGKCR